MNPIYPLPQNHPQRFRLHNEVHARAPISVTLPVLSTYLAFTLTADEKKRELASLTQLCDKYNVNPPQTEDSHFTAQLDSLQLRWEQHAEFSSYSFYCSNPSTTPFKQTALERVPSDWLQQLPGQLITAIHASILDQKHLGENPSEAISNLFFDHPIVGSTVSGGAASAFTDFKIHADGFSRFLILNRELKPGQAGRLLQRLFEIEVYRVMAMMAFPISKQLTPLLNQADQQLLNITADMSDNRKNDGLLLDELTSLAASIENNISAHQYRFSAANAYYTLVEQRINDLREERIQGLQTIGEFMKRRLEPAIKTCTSTSNRFSSLSRRINNASQLLRTRVDLAIETQNQALLKSMDARAKMQLRLQETVEF